VTKELSIVIVGAGMYVCGRGTPGFGTILPAVYEWHRRGWRGALYVAGTRTEGARVLREKVEGLNVLYGATLQPIYLPDSQDDARAFETAINVAPRPACAVIAVPDHLHTSVARQTIGAGFHTLVVKPLAPTSAEIEQLIAAQDAAGVYCAVELHKRLDRSNLMLKDTIRSGRIGDPLYVIVEYSQRRCIPQEQFRRWAANTNVFQYLGIHYVDIINDATGATPARVTATAQKRWLASHGVDTYDAVQALVEWRLPDGGSFSSSILTNWIDPNTTSAMSDQRIKVVGTRGRYEADQKSRGITIVTDDGGIEEPNPDFCAIYQDASGRQSVRGYGIDSVVQFLDDAAQVEAGQASVSALTDRPTFVSQVAPTAVIEAVNASLAADGRWVPVTLARPTLSIAG